MGYRVHTQADWPKKFDTMAGAISFLIARQPLWYILEERKDDVWIIVVDRHESRTWMNRVADPGVEDRG